MKNKKSIITLLIFWKFITEKNLKGNMLYLLPFMAIAWIIQSIFGIFLYLSVKLMHLPSPFVRTIALLVTLAIPAFLIYNYARNKDTEKLRLQFNRLNIRLKKKIKKRGYIALIIIALLPFFSLGIISLLNNLNII